MSEEFTANRTENETAIIAAIENKWKPNCPVCGKKMKKEGDGYICKPPSGCGYIVGSNYDILQNIIERLNAHGI